MPRLSFVRSALFVALTASSTTFLCAQDGKPEPGSLVREAQAAVQSGDWTTAAALFTKLTEAEPKVGRHWHMLGYSLHAGNRLDEALKAHHRATEFDDVRAPATYNVACVHALKGDADQAFAWLEKAIDAGFADADLLETDSDLAGIRADPRFAKLAPRLAAKRAARPAQPPRAFAVVTPRRCARAVWFDNVGNTPGQFAIDWTPVRWKPEFEKIVDAPASVGRHWRLGGDFWTKLDTSLALDVGGVAIEPGEYYLTLRNLGERRFFLCVHDTAPVRAQRLDASQVHRLKGGREIPLALTTGDEVSDELAFRCAFGGTDTAGEIVLRFGPHTLRTKVAVVAR